jgi:5'-deoxynucleotidase
VITGYLPSPVKYHSPAIQQAYHSIERSAERELVALLPAELQADFAALVIAEQVPAEHHQLVKAADTLSAYLKCQAEVKAGNREFEKAAEEIKQRLDGLHLPEVDYFLDTFVPSYQLTLDELLLHPNRAAKNP